jgi:sugar phosphate isomerase/epimerase
MRLACSTSSFPEDRWEIAVAKCAWADYGGLELALGEGPPPPEDELRMRIRANELVLAALHAGEIPAADGSPSLVELARIGRAATLARALDGSLVVVRAPAEGSLEELAASLRMLDGALGDTAVDLCLANRVGTLLASREALGELWRLGLPQRIGLAVDPGHALLAGWDPADLEALPELPRHVYLNDAAGGRIVPPGEGALDLPALGKRLRSSGYGGAVSLALENADPWAVEPTAREIRHAAEAWFPSLET